MLRRQTHLRLALLVAAVCSFAPSLVRAQEMGAPMGFDNGTPPMTHQGGGSFLSQDLGTILRLGYYSESYGQDGHGNFSIGTMPVITFEDSIMFFDGQVTMNDVQGVGFNLGVGYRWLSFAPYALDMGRMEGVSIWADGTRTEASNFFPQLGLSYESLGETWDVRANGYIPLGAQSQTGTFERTGEIGFQGFSIAQLTQAVVDTSFYVAEVEVARRLGAQRDAWAFAGPYFLANDDDDAVGWRAGLRGYAYPDLLLQVAISDDDIFKTNATFSATWFVGRTRTDFQPACGVPDRFREPVQRNNYVVLAQSTAQGGIPLTQPDGTALRIVHVNSEAAAGGDGSFENPFNMLSLVDDPGNSQQGDIILAWAESNFVNDSIMLRNNQRLLGEGDGFVHTVTTFERGTIEIPETSPGARNADRPMIVNAMGDVIRLANDNEVTNFDIEGGARAIVATAAMGGGHTLRELLITDTTSSAMRFENLTRNVTINNVDVMGGTGFALDFLDVATTSTVNVTGFDYDGGAAAAGGMRFSNFDGTFNVSTSTLEGGTLQAVNIFNGSSGTFSFANTVTFTDIGATVFDVDGFSGSLTVHSSIENDTGFAVSLANIDGANAQAIFTGDITNTDRGIRVIDSNRAFVQFTGDVTLTTGANDAITLTNNSNANTDINFNGDVVINTTSGRGFFAMTGGELTAAGTNNSITTTTGTAVAITGSAISNLGVNFGEINVTTAGATNAILLQNNTGGPIVLGTLGDDAGESGTIAATTGDAIVIENSANVTVSGLRLANNPNPVAGVRVTKNTAGTQTVNLNDLEINGGRFGVDVTGGAGTLNMTVNDTAINTSTETGMRFTNVDAGTIQVNDTTIDGNNAMSTAGVLITDSDANFTFNNATVVREVSGTAFQVSGGTGNVTMSGNITNTAGDSVRIQNRTGGTVAMSGTVNDTGTGVTIQNNTGGNVNLLGTYNLTTGANDAVEILNNTGADISVSGLTINTTSGTGFRATGGGDLTVAGTTNTITTTTGTGLNINGMNIVGQANFQSVTVNGAANGIVLNNVTGAPVTVGSQTGATNSGGTLNTTGDAIQVTNVENAVFNNVRIQNAGGNGITLTHDNTTDNSMDVTLRGLNLLAAAGDGIAVTAGNNQTNETFELRLLANNSGVSNIQSNVDVAVTGSANFLMLVDNTDINTGAGNDIAFSLTFSGNADSGDVTIRNGSNFIADDASALFIDSSGGTAKTIRLLVENSDFMNDSAGSATSDILSRGNTLFNATLRGNTFENLNPAGSDFDMTATGAQARMRLNLGGDDPSQFNTAAGVGEFNLIEMAGGDFRIFEAADTIAGNRNTGTVVLDPNDPNEFPNLATPPPLPTVP